MENLYANRLKARICDSKKEVSMGDWICENTTKSGKKFSFDKFPFQKAIADDMHPSVCVKKLSQVGLSEINYRKMIGFLARNRGTTGLYTFPDLAMKKKQVQTRIRPIFDSDFPPRQNLNDVRNTDVLQLNDSFLYVSGNTESDATSTAVDFIMNDEYDLSDQEFLALVNSRIQASDYKFKHGFSTPTFTGYGISLEYQSSDQREYWYKCEHCGHWQIPLYDLKHVYIPDLPDTVEDLKTDIDDVMATGLNLDDSYVFCEKCGKKLCELSNGERREWVARYPERLNTHGYWVRPFSSAVLSIKYLVTTMADFRKKNHLRRGINTVLGEEYNDSDAKIDREAIMACMESRKTPDISKDKPVFVGIDMGLSCHLSLSCDDSTFFFFETYKPEELLDKLKELDRKYKIVAGAIDRYPYTPTANAIRDWSEGRIFPLDYHGEKTAEPIKDVDGKVSYYKINRTEALDEVMQNIKSGVMRIYGYGNYQNIIVEHLRDMFRDDSISGRQPRWRKITGNDHFFHSMAYSLVARKISYVQGLRGEKQDDRSEVLMYGEKNLYNNELLSYNSYGNNRRILKRW